ncbi:MAG: cupin domain-containing protein, partial [Oscillospiraceae bacterium]|nr:cupin domain-containing protein [Oscillospiraceae bacterium]
MATYSFSRAEPAPPARGAPRMVYITRDQYSEDWNSNLHTHGCAELFFITDGHGRFRTQSEEFPVSIRDLIIINANVPHTELSQADSPLEYTVLGVEGLETMAGAEGYTMLHLHSGWEELTSLLELMLREARAALPGCEQACGALLSVILIRLGRQSETALSGTSVRIISGGNHLNIGRLHQIVLWNVNISTNHS